MKVDLYTKVVLTVIATCLVILALGGTGVAPFAQAQYGAQQVELVNTGLLDRGGQVLKVQIVSVDEAPNLEWESLHVDAR